jgi:hypothetical protein
LKGQLTFEPVEGGTRIVVVLELNGTEESFFDKLTLPIYTRTVERELETDLAWLKYLLEVAGA